MGKTGLKNRKLYLALGLGAVLDGKVRQNLIRDLKDDELEYTALISELFMMKGEGTRELRKALTDLLVEVSKSFIQEYPECSPYWFPTVH